MADTWYAIFAAGTTPADSDPISLASVDHGATKTVEHPDKTISVVPDPEAIAKRVDFAALDKAGHAYVELDSDPTGKLWDKGTQTFVDPPAPPTILSKADFLLRFTPAQVIAMLNTKDDDVKYALFMVQNSTTVDLDGPIAQGLLEKSLGAGIIDQIAADAVQVKAVV